MTETVFGDRLHQARTLRQRKLADLAERLDCSVPTLSKWEHARTVEITERQLSLLTDTLRFSPAFFSTRPPSPLTDNDLLFKAPKGMLRREVAWLREFVRLLSELLDWLDDQRHLPPVKIRPLSRDHTNIPEAARELRAALGFEPSRLRRTDRLHRRRAQRHSSKPRPAGSSNLRNRRRPRRATARLAAPYGHTPDPRFR